MRAWIVDDCKDARRQKVKWLRANRKGVTVRYAWCLSDVVGSCDLLLIDMSVLGPVTDIMTGYRQIIRFSQDHPGAEILIASGIGHLAADIVRRQVQACVDVKVGVVSYDQYRKY